MIGNEASRKIETKYTTKQYLKFIIPSIIGMFMFLVPIKWNGNWTVMTGVATTEIQTHFKAELPWFMIILFGVSLIITLITKLLKPKIILKSKTLTSLFDVSMFNIIMRAFSFLFTVMIVYKKGPEMIWSIYTGGTALDLTKTLIVGFFVAGLLIPLLLDFGIMEFIGIIVKDVMKPLFTIPGRATLDCLASWVGSGTVGIVITGIQYDEGYYTKREASVIATCFSIVSVPFCLVFVNAIGLEHMFIQMYITVSVSCFIAAIVLPRIPPLSNIKDTYYEPVGKQINEEVEDGNSKVKLGLELGLKKADMNKSAMETIKKGFVNVFDVWIGLMPLVMVVATLALVVVEHTPIFKYLSLPIVPILEMLNIPEASAAAPAFIVGFVDIFIPVVIGIAIKSEFTRFIIVCLSCTQLIFMTETGAVIMKSNIGLSFMELLKIYILRTLITLPVIIIMARYIFF